MTDVFYLYSHHSAKVYTCDFVFALAVRHDLRVRYWYLCNFILAKYMTPASVCSKRQNT